jgi:hypothetical protein
VRETRGISAFDDGIDHHTVHSTWVVHMSLKGDVVEVRKVLAQLVLVLTKFDHILFLEPSPGRVNLSKVFSH